MLFCLCIVRLAQFEFSRIARPPATPNESRVKKFSSGVSGCVSIAERKNQNSTIARW